MTSLAFEDFVPGAVSTYGAYKVTREEIVAFASRFDAQPMHLDEAAASTSMLGGLAASGWHTCAMLMRLFADNVLRDSTGMGAPGIDELKWLRPVRPGDVLGVRMTVLEARPSATRADRGYVRFRFEVTNQDGAVVMEQTNSVIFGRRGAGEAA
ncbi:MaoC family dehydratase [Alsobacter sp. SYSU M60028]|uniref:MaoC family dehydratase n=1 Tax=Alsobacter ponti TaxID=2962936 RepID=A0ABT1L6H9_9HYPH|nr:MaoC family dehydratase [Alsobacter ponti]MCP8937015.1 MaoC family dehydratase [Alsobacter ponti]